MRTAIIGGTGTAATYLSTYLGHIGSILSILCGACTLAIIAPKACVSIRKIFRR